MLRAQLEAITPDIRTSFLVNVFALERFTAPYHFHPEYELTWIVKGKGTRFVGKHMADYGPGDLVFLGPGLPHCWKSGDVVPGALNSHSVVVQFERDFLGAEFFDKPELDTIAGLMKRSACGIRFPAHVAAIVTPAINALSREENAFRKMLRLLGILETLAHSKEYTLLDHDGILAKQHPGDRDRLNISLGYIVDNFRNEMVLSEVAAAASMSVNAFCRYFRKSTGKTFIETVTDYRIHFAVQQLLSTDQSMACIAFESGFGDVSNFYRVFKRRLKTSPLQDRKNFLRGLQTTG